jgi:hypothetical protein
LSGPFEITASGLAWFVYVTDGGATYRVQMRKSIGLFFGNALASMLLPILPKEIRTRRIWVSAMDTTLNNEHEKLVTIGSKTNVYYQGLVQPDPTAVLDNLVQWQVFSKIGQSTRQPWDQT